MRGNDLSLRASDAEREQVVGELHHHAAAGRLTIEELEERIEQAYAARTLGELRAVTHDLPAPVPAKISRAHLKRAKRIRRLRYQAASAAATEGVCVAVWAATGAGSFWPGWVALALGLGLVGRARRAFAPVLDDDEIRRQLARRAQTKRG